MPQHAVLIHIPLSNDSFGTYEEQAALSQLEDQLQKAIETEGREEFDGDEYGGGLCKLYCYGPDADKLLKVIEPIVLHWGPPPGSYTIARYGDARDPNSVERRIELG